MPQNYAHHAGTVGGSRGVWPSFYFNFGLPSLAIVDIVATRLRSANPRGHLATLLWKPCCAAIIVSDNQIATIEALIYGGDLDNTLHNHKFRCQCWYYRGCRIVDTPLG